MLEIDLSEADAVVVFSDVHGSLEALEAFLADVEAKKQKYGWNRVDFFNLGDNWGYGPNPVECSKKVNEISSGVLMGNHEYLVDTLIEKPELEPRLLKISKKAIKGIYWTIQQIFGDDTPIDDDLDIAKKHVVQLVKKFKDIKSYKKQLEDELIKKLDPYISNSLLERLAAFFTGTKSIKKKNLKQMFSNTEVRPLVHDYLNKIETLEQADVSKLPFEAILKVKKGEIYATHANILNPQNFHYIVGPDHPDYESFPKYGSPEYESFVKNKGIHLTDEIFAKWPKKLENISDVMVAHMHWAGGYTNGKRFILSVGSVGASRFCEEPVAEYAYFCPDEKGLKLKMVKVPYDHKTSVAKAKKVGLSDPTKLKVA